MTEPQSSWPGHEARPRKEKPEHTVTPPEPPKQFTRLAGELSHVPMSPKKLRAARATTRTLGWIVASRLYESSKRLMATIEDKSGTEEYAALLKSVGYYEMMLRKFKSL